MNKTICFAAAFTTVIQLMGGPINATSFGQPGNSSFSTSKTDISGIYKKGNKTLKINKNYKLILVEDGDFADYSVEGSTISVTNPMFGGAEGKIVGSTLVFPKAGGVVAKSLQGTWVKQDGNSLTNPEYNAKPKQRLSKEDIINLENSGKIPNNIIIIGKWKMDGIYFKIRFFEDNTCKVYTGDGINESETGSYAIDGDKITIHTKLTENRFFQGGGNTTIYSGTIKGRIITYSTNHSPNGKFRIEKYTVENHRYNN